MAPQAADEVKMLLLLVVAAATFLGGGDMFGDSCRRDRGSGTGPFILCGIGIGRVRPRA